MHKFIYGFILGLLAWLLIDLPQTIKRVAMITDLQMAMIDEIYQMRKEQDRLRPFEDFLNDRSGQ